MPGNEESQKSAVMKGLLSTPVIQGLVVLSASCEPSTNEPDTLMAAPIGAHRRVSVRLVHS
jgi:hypothetical protein